MIKKTAVRYYFFCLTIQIYEKDFYLKIYNSETEIDIEELPNQFVFKTNHGSESLEAWQDDIRQMLALDVAHLSAYCLMVEEV